MQERDAISPISPIGPITPDTALSPHPPSEPGPEFQSYCKNLATAKGLANRMENLVTWGEARNGLQAGVAMLGIAQDEKPLPAWIIVRNTSTTEPREFQAPKHVKLRAKTPDGADLAVSEWPCGLAAGDEGKTFRLAPGEQLEIPLVPLEFAEEGGTKPTRIQVGTRVTSCSLTFSLNGLPDGASLEAGTATVSLLGMGIPQQIRDEQRLQAMGAPKVELEETETGSLLMLRREKALLCLYCPGKIKQNLSLREAPGGARWQLEGSLEWAGCAKPAQVSWVSDSHEEILIGGQKWSFGYGISIPAATQPDPPPATLLKKLLEEGPLAKELWLVVGPDGKLTSGHYLDGLRDVAAIQEALGRKKALDAKHAVSQKLALDPARFLAWSEWEDSRWVLKLRLDHDGRVTHIPTPGTVVTRMLPPKELVRVMKLLKSSGLSDLSNGFCSYHSENLSLEVNPRPQAQGVQPGTITLQTVYKKKPPLDGVLKLLLDLAAVGK